MNRVIVAAFNDRVSTLWKKIRYPSHLPVERPGLDVLFNMPREMLPRLVQESPVALEVLELLGPLNWEEFPEQCDLRVAPGPIPQRRAPYVGAFILKIHRNLRYMSDLRTFLVENPAVVWLLGFELKPSNAYRWGFDSEKSLSCRRQFGRVLRKLHPSQSAFLLDSSVHLIQTALPSDALPEGMRFGDEISLDTKHIIAWVRENNPKAFMPKAHDKTVQPKGDADCKLGCKKSSNQSKKAEKASKTGATVPDAPPKSNATPETPKQDGVPGSQSTKKGTYFWGYASGIVVTKVAEWGEFVLAELTDTFDKEDKRYFHPLMAQTEERLGYRPRWGALDAAYDAHYVYDYFHQAEGFAAVPFSNRGGHGKREFGENDLPLCEAGLEMPVKRTYQCGTSMIPHQKAHFGCPLLHPEVTGEACPIDHKKFAKNGCNTTMATSDGARIRYQLDRDSDAYKKLYKQRTATERINSIAVEYNIERPKLRNKDSIANNNTLIYVLINLQALQRIQARKQQLAKHSV